MKIAIIGGGNMGGATAIAFAKRTDNRICVSDKMSATLDKFATVKGIETTTDNRKAVEGADIAMIAVKPWLVPVVIEEIKDLVAGKLVVCIAAGVEGSALKSWLAPSTRIIRVIPNIAIEYGESMSFIAPVEASQEDIALVKSLFESSGSALVTDEKHLGAGMALASCGIAYALRYIRAASEGGVELGFYAGEAAEIVKQTVKGAAALLDQGGHPETEIDKVTTPGGYTIKGLNAMEEAGFTAAVIKGLKASC